MKPLSNTIDEQIALHGLELNFSEDELKHIPADKPGVVIARHLVGDLDVLLMLRVLLQRNPNSKIILFEENPFQELFPERFIHVSLTEGGALRELLKMKSLLGQHLLEGGLLGLFPARKQFYTKKKDRKLDQKWESGLIRLVSNMKLPVVPMALNKVVTDDESNALVNARIGSAISVQEQEAFSSNSRLTKFFRARTLSLGTPIDVKQFYFPSKTKLDARHQIAPPIADELIHKEIQGLRDAGQLLFTQSEFEVLCARAAQIPNTLLEIGRLREITFRDVEEGSNKPRDIDEYDLYYEQLIIYDKEAGKLAGGYRLGRGDNIFEAYGIKGFYIASFFKFKKKFGDILKESVELGRAYIVPDYQKKRLPLFLLWRGILSFLLVNPQYKYLIGPLSISQQYSDISKHVIIEFVKQNYYDHDLAAMVKPRKPYQIKTKEIDTEVILENLQGEISKLDNFIEDIEPYHFRIPVLMKKYIKQNARIISFNVDPDFNYTLDGLMILDLAQLPQETIDALQKGLQ